MYHGGDDFYTHIIHKRYKKLNTYRCELQGASGVNVRRQEYEETDLKTEGRGIFPLYAVYSDIA